MTIANPQHDARAISMLTGTQIRAARALIGWSARDLAGHSAVSWHTVQRAEAARGNTPNIQALKLASIQKALESAGVIFLPDGLNGGPGVRLKAPG